MNDGAPVVTSHFVFLKYRNLGFALTQLEQSHSLRAR